MKKIRKSAELMWIFGTIFVALGVSICSKSNLGVSMIAAPAFVISEYVSTNFNWITVGVTEYIIQGLLLILLIILIRKFDWRFLLAFVVAIIYGYVLNLFIFIFKDLTIDNIVLRWITLIVGDIITAFGVACYFRTYLPLQVYELFVSQTASKFKLSINKTKWIFDISLLIISIILAFTLFSDYKTFDFTTIWYTNYHNLGLGTIVTTIINSPIIAFMGRIIDKIFEPLPRFEKFYNLLYKK